MDNNEKALLRQIVREVPKHIADTHSMAEIHHRYASEFNYNTFKRYWKALRE